MPTCLRGAVSGCLGLAVACSLLSVPTCAQEVWSGLTYSFSKPDGEDGSLPEFQDTITPNAIFARGFTGGLYNASSESSWIASSPEFTEWATDLVAGNEGEAIVATNYADLQFTAWHAAYGAGGDEGLHTRIQGRSAVVHLIPEDVYFDLEFSYWGAGHFGGAGGFAYMRAESPSLEPTGDYNENHIVDAADYTIWRDTLGSMTDLRANGDDTGLSAGVVDNADYDYWKARLGPVPPGAGGGQAGAVPEPSTILLLVGGLLMLATFRKFSPRGPGQTF